MNPLQGMAPLAGMALGVQPQEEGFEGFTLQAKKKGPRRLLADLLRTDPQMAEMMKTMRLGQGDDMYEDNRQ